MFQIVATLPFPWIIHCCTRHKFDYYVCSLFRLSLMGGKVEFSDMWDFIFRIIYDRPKTNKDQSDIVSDASYGPRPYMCVSKLC